jgi:hypothetical protein
MEHIKKINFVCHEWIKKIIKDIFETHTWSNTIRRCTGNAMGHGFVKAKT